MISAKRYNTLIALFPIVYLIHNYEEWIVFSNKVNTIAEHTPNFIRGYFTENTSSVVTIFGIGLIIATLIPLAVSFAVWNKPNLINLKILTIIAFVTLFNAISHITSSILFSIIGPGLITGLILCFPFSVFVLIQVFKNHHFTLKEYIVFIMLSIFIYLIAIVFSWISGVGIYSLFYN